MNYPFSVYFTQVEDHKFWVAECKILKGCVGQGETAEDAIAELNANIDTWLETAKECGIPIPEIPIENEIEYSGKFTVRVSPHIHRKTVELAKKQGISLNQYVNDAIVSQNATLTTINHINPMIQDTIQKMAILMKTTATTATSNQSYTMRNPFEPAPATMLYKIQN